MKQLFILSVLATVSYQVNAQPPTLQQVKQYEHQLDDVMEIIDTTVLKQKLEEVENDFHSAPSAINRARLGIVCHEVALNLSFLTKSSYKGYASKSYEILDTLFQSESTDKGLLPFVASYRASALALKSSETKKLSLLSTAFDQLEDAAQKYGAVSYCPEFIRSSIAENLPWFFFRKKKFAAIDFASVIRKYEQNNDYASDKIMSFTYWGWANQNRNARNREKAISYLHKAISLDADYQAGRKRAEELLETLL